MCILGRETDCPCSSGEPNFLKTSKYNFHWSGFLSPEVTSLMTSRGIFPVAELSGVGENMGWPCCRWNSQWCPLISSIENYFTSTYVRTYMYVCAECSYVLWGKIWLPGATPLVKVKIDSHAARVNAILPNTVRVRYGIRVRYLVHFLQSFYP